MTSCEADDQGSTRAGASSEIELPTGESLNGVGNLREVLRIGQLEGPEEYTFPRIYGLTVSPKGDFYVADSDGDLRQFDSEGRFVRWLARQGAGPGETDYVVGLATAPDGTLGVVDFGNRRIMLWSPEGEYLQQITQPPGRTRYGREAISFDSIGQIWLGLFPPRAGPGAVQPGENRPIYARLTEDGELVDTIFLPGATGEACLDRDPALLGVVGTKTFGNGSLPCCSGAGPREAP